MIAVGNTCDRQKALRELEAAGDRVCCYGGLPWPERTCDCKFKRPSAQAWSVTSEMTGCPELRTAWTVIASMTDEAFETQIQVARHLELPA